MFCYHENHYDTASGRVCTTSGRVCYYLSWWLDMRTITESLRVAQASSSVKPFIHLQFHGPSGNTYDYSYRVINLEHQEKPYDDWAEIYLYDNDRQIPDLRGYWTEIGYGAHLATGSVEYSATPRLWVKNKQLYSFEGNLFMVLHCEGVFSHLAESNLVVLGEPPEWEGQYPPDFTIYDTITNILEAYGYSLDTLGGQDDGIIDTLCPQLWVNENPFENPLEVIYRLIAMTKCFLRPKTNLAFEIRFPQESDTVQEHYSYNSPHYFHQYMEKINEVIPNHIVVFYNQDEDGGWTNVQQAEAFDDDSIVRCKTLAPTTDGKITRYHIAADLTSATDANNRASAILTREKFEELAGQLVVPHDCRVELYDRVGIYDER